jgi:hypothetical protein
VSDLDIARAMIAEIQACSLDYEADSEFAMAIGLDPDTMTAKDEARAHRRRLAALRELVRLGEAESYWMGIWCPPPGAPTKARIYRRIPS